MACDRSYGLCSVPSSFPVTITVTVSQSLPVVQQVGSTPILLFSQPGVLLDPPQYSAPNLLQNSTLYQAYVNCPINPIPFAFSTSGSFDLLSMSLIDPPSNFASTGLSTPAGVKLSTPALYPKAAITDNGFDISNVQSYWSYTALSWTPPMDVAGRRFVVCVQATDRLGASAVRCVELSVARCVYCTLAGDTLRSVAAAYHSNWLQVCRPACACAWEIDGGEVCRCGARTRGGGRSWRTRSSRRQGLLAGPTQVCPFPRIRLL
mmetsp:Transcript_88933/g.237069  ORF Transcript_88933/g.237069 Transcript_88933/m.237069 type:complete len:263 (-) Transcript_88933:658-1446(-)